MKFYWSDLPLSGATEVRSEAISITVDPVSLYFDDELMGVFTRTNSGRGYDNIVGHFKEGICIVSSDEIPRLVNISGTVKRIGDWLLDWERATFRWIEEPLRSIDDPFQVTLSEPPARSRNNDRDDHEQFEYRLSGKEFVPRG